MYGARLSRSEWLGPLAPTLPARIGLPPAPAGRGTPVPVDRALFPLRGTVDGGSTSRSGSPGVNVTPVRPAQPLAPGSEGRGSSARLSAAAVTSPAQHGAGDPDRDLTAAEARWSAGAGATGTAVVAWVMLLAALALAIWAPRPVNPATGVPSLTAVHLVVVPVLVLAGVWLLERLHRVTRRVR